VSPASADAAWAHQAALDIWVRLAARDFAGWDPYDALNTRLIPKVITRPRVASRLLTQAVKRCPIPLQPVLMIKREVDAYTLAHVLLAGARLRGAAPTAPDAGGPDAPPAVAPGGAALDLDATCRQVVARLRSMAVAQGDGLAWGYHFPVHTRFFSYAPPTPNLIVTAFVAKGMAAVTRAGAVDCRAEIRGAVDFILHHLPRVSDQSGDCIGYVPGEAAAVHNANMLAALVLCEAAALASEPDASQIATQADAGPADASAKDSWLEQALRCALFTAARQSPDGSWPYSEESFGRWVDGFHTGFVLEGLAAVVRATGDAGLAEALRRGLRFYVAQLFGPAGEPKYYPARAYPLDALSAAQGVETLQVALRGAAPGGAAPDGAAPGGAALGDGASQAVPSQLQWVRDHLLRPGGKVTYQVHRCWSDRREFPRWASAPLMSALAGVPSRTVCGPCTVACTEFRTVACTENAPSSTEPFPKDVST
jgi:hypothetical protein